MSRTLLEPSTKSSPFGSIIGASPAMQRVYDLIEQVAPSNAPVLILGETGTGKELVARAIHRMSRRRKRGFVPLNCGAVPESLIESELFGHKKGAFTGATQDRQGVFARADGGTLLLDEITEMPVELQPKLLRVLETGEYHPVGSETPNYAEVRLLASTNRSPREAIEEGVLREDLLYRINVFPIEIPPLRDRRGDAELIARHILQGLNRENETEKELAPEAVEQLENHPWPGNVRELINVVHRAFLLAGDRIERLSFADTPGTPPLIAIERNIRSFVGHSVAEMERELILATLEACAGNKTQAAEMLGISVKTLYNRLNRYGEESKRATRHREDSTNSPVKSKS